MYMNGNSSPQLQTSDPNAILLHLVDGQARMETKIDHLTDRISKVESRADKPRPERRPLSEYLPIAYGIGLLAAVLTGKLSVLQMIAAIRG